MGAMILPSRFNQQPQQAAQIDPALRADFAWVASAPKASLAGPGISAITATQRATADGMAISSGYATVASAAIPSLYATTWTEVGAVLLDGTTQTNTLSARDTGQAVVFIPSLNKIDLVMWGVVDVDVVGTLPTGVVRYVVRRSGTAHAIWLNGRLFGTASAANAPVASNGTLPAIGSEAGSGGSSAGHSLVSTNGVLAVARTGLVLPDALCQQLSVNPWQIFAAPPRRLWAVAAGAASNTPVNPAAGALTITSYAPSVAQSANQSIAPGAGGLAFTGFAPSMVRTAGASVLPGAGALGLTGYPPAVTQTQNIALTLGAAQLAVTGYAPTVAQTAPVISFSVRFDRLPKSRIDVVHFSSP